MSVSEQFLAGQRFAKGLIDTYRDAQQRRKLDEIDQDKPVESSEFTPEQGQQIEAAAAGGKNYIGYDDKIKAYMATPKLADGEMGPAQPVEIARQAPMTEFLGKRYPGTMTPDQVTNARQLARAEVISKSDPIQGMRLQREVKQGERDDKRWMREDTAATKAEADKAFAEKLDGQVGEWFKGRLKNPDGTERAPTVDDHLAASQYRAAQLTGAGKIDQAGQVLKDYAAQSLVKIQLQGAQRKEALGRTAAALASGDLDAVKGFYNEFVPDGARVTDVKRGADGELVIQRESLDGRPLPAYTMKDTGQLLSVLNSFNDPMALYSWSQNEFKNNIDVRKTEVSERQADIAERRLGALEARANGGGGGRGGGRRGEEDAPSFNPLASFDSKKAQAVAFEQAAAAVDDKGSPLSPQEQGKRAQEIYRSMEDAFATENTRRQRATVFRTEARNATTPEEIEAVRQRAAASGYTAEEMAALDKRFAPKAPDAAPAASGKKSAEPQAPSQAASQEPVAPRGGRPAVYGAFFGERGNTQPATAQPAEQPRTGRSPQTLGDDFQSPMARQALQARVAEAANGGPPLSSVEKLRAQQLRLL
ncbi:MULTISPECIES: hypothetical protein [unclassified Acidovorax]|uniref:hypothetical protein n=1 Tax=unclassified Acidovorax TaxID=2684926 RepID=UPI000BC5578A|nr:MULTISPECIES: hypothetical protein [unclassified Acidovorax]OZA55715.1 MAG: hypothetical protein B7X79_13905 [Acidovorax sp. 17-64-282]HQS22647.1 hypothetical protein [Acidovorax defluvii]OYY25765.1 MAG: hypothetical protein B7Y64_18400 [Acidovorax sp. 35-64-16]OYY83191.1 MAG: hypothetical protein B7Y46_16175 [Acidovorax sp. 28-64-14]OZA66981.1 MAG: hypothetical protein B7X70_18700 [Acidovorax sp. 39-64-12]